MSMPVPCEHDWDIREGHSDTKAVKVTICKKCREIKNVLIQGEVKKDNGQSVWDLKDRRIARENALSHATLLAIRLNEILPDVIAKDKMVNMTLDIAGTLETWIYRP